VLWVLFTGCAWSQTATPVPTFTPVPTPTGPYYLHAARGDGVNKAIQSGETGQIDGDLNVANDLWTQGSSYLNGAIYGGLEDSAACAFYLYGNATTVGPYTIWDNAGEEDGTVVYWKVEPNGTVFYLGPDTDLDAFRFHNTGLEVIGDVTVESNLTVGSLTSPWDNVIIVAQSGGDETVIQTAINTAAAAASSGDRWTVLVMPGEYTETLTMKSNVSLVGLNRDACVIKSNGACLLYTSPSPRDRTRSRMPSSA